VLCRGLEKNGVCMASVNQTRPHYVNQTGKTHSKSLAARHCSGTGWARHGHGMLFVNRPLKYSSYHKEVEVHWNPVITTSGYATPCL
jgi:hypothetical protein